MMALAETINESNPKNISIITNSIPVASLLSQNRNYEITISGGVLQHNNMSIIGPDADAFFERILVNTAFIGSTGVYPSLGLTVSSPFHVSVKRKMISSANRVIALIDSSKFSTIGINVFCTFDQLSTIITVRTEENSKIIDDLIDRGVDIVLA